VHSRRVLGAVALGAIVVAAVSFGIVDVSIADAEHCVGAAAACTDKSVPPVAVSFAALGVLALVKFATVVGYFMHLKFDSRILRRLFVTGLILAVAVYCAYMLTLGVFVTPPGSQR